MNNYSNVYSVPLLWREIELEGEREREGEINVCVHVCVSFIQRVHWLIHVLYT